MGPRVKLVRRVFWSVFKTDLPNAIPIKGLGGNFFSKLLFTRYPIYNVLGLFPYVRVLPFKMHQVTFQAFKFTLIIISLQIKLTFSAGSGYSQVIANTGRLERT